MEDSRGNTWIPSRDVDELVEGLNWEHKIGVEGPIAEYGTPIIRPDARRSSEKTPVKTYPYDCDWKSGYGFDISTGDMSALTGGDGFFLAKLISVSKDTKDKPLGARGGQLWFQPSTEPLVMGAKKRGWKPLRRFIQRERKMHCGVCEEYLEDTRCINRMCAAYRVMNEVGPGKCPECPSRKLLNDEAKGKIWCEECGLVIIDKMIDTSGGEENGGSGSPIQSQRKGLLEIQALRLDTAVVKLMKEVREESDLDWKLNGRVLQRLVARFTNNIKTPRIMRNHRRVRRWNVAQTDRGDFSRCKTPKQRNELRNRLSRSYKNDPKYLILIHKTTRKTLHCGELDYTQESDITDILQGNAIRWNGEPFDPANPGFPGGVTLVNILVQRMKERDRDKYVEKYHYQDFLNNKQNSCPDYYAAIAVGFILMGHAKYEGVGDATIKNEDVAALHKFLLGKTWKCLCPCGCGSDPVAARIEAGRQEAAENYRCRCRHYQSWDDETKTGELKGFEWDEMSIVSSIEFIRRFVTISMNKRLEWVEWVSA